MDNLIKEKLFSYIDENTEKMISDLGRLIRIPSVRGEAEMNAPFGKYPAAALDEVLKICGEAGLSVRNIDNYVGTADFYPTTDIPELGILSHMDVVPVGSGWSVPPFELTEKDGKLLGRGAIDDKGPAIAALYAVKAIKAAGIKLKKNVRLIFGTDEECGSSDLAYYRKKEQLPEMLFTPDGSYPVINTEKGMLRISYHGVVSENIVSIHGGTVINAVPEYAEAVLNGVSVDIEKYSFDGVTLSTEELDGNIKITANGRSAHASTPESGKNAVTALLEVVADVCGDKTVAALSKMFPYGETDGTSAGIRCSDEISGSLTTVLSVVSCTGGINGNFEAKEDIRFPANKTSEEIITVLKAVADGLSLEISVDMISEPHHVPEESEFIQKLISVYELVTGEKGYCVAIGGGTYVHETEGGVAFGAEFPGEENNMHGADEFITRESLVKNAKIFAAAIYSLCVE